MNNQFFQMGNIVTGYELIQRAEPKSKNELFGILLPLVTSESGQKFGKTDGAPIWLSAEKTTAYDLYQVEPKQSFFLKNRTLL
jgi:tyrosyl-tRNA synthetase